MLEDPILKTLVDCEPNSSKIPIYIMSHMWLDCEIQNTFYNYYMLYYHNINEILCKQKLYIVSDYKMCIPDIFTKHEILLFLLIIYIILYEMVFVHNYQQTIIRMFLYFHLLYKKYTSIKYYDEVYDIC